MVAPRAYLHRLLCLAMPIMAPCFVPLRHMGSPRLIPKGFDSPSSAAVRPVARTGSLGLVGLGMEEESVGRRAALAITFAPLATVATMYAAVPLVLNKGMRKQGWYKEYFAGAMQDMDEYEQGIAGIKRDLFSVVAPTDSVVDFGAGLAPNIKYLPPSVTYTAVEPNLFMHKSIEERSSVLEKKNPVLTTLNDVPSSSQDIVISTLVLCSVDNQDEAIGQIMRVLKPGGKLLFLEHVIEIDQGYPAPYNIDVFDWGRATYRWAQQALSPLQVALADGCHPARDTMAMINEAFTDVFFKRFDVPYLWGKDDWASFFPIGPQVAGIAVKGKSKKNPGVYAEVQFKFCAPGQSPLMADPTGDTDKQREWQESGEAGKALSSQRKNIKCQ